MPRIRLAETGQAIDYRPGSSLLDILAEAGAMPPSPCGGSGICGKCGVTVQGPGLPLPTTQETELFTTEELASGRRLACLVFPEGDLDVSVPLQEKESAILSHGYLPAFELDPAVARKKDADSGEGLYGLAVDIGTTTVVASLLDLHTGEELAVRSAINPQKKWGFDVLNRLSFMMEHPGEGVRALQKAVVDCLNELVAGLGQDAGVPAWAVHDVAVAANTTMMHVLLGVDPSSMGRAPFTPPFTKAQSLPATEIGLHAADGATVYCLPSVSAFIGADIVAGMLVSGLKDARDTVLFIDIGTNGEMVLARDGRLCACSCAAGPALEGMNISSGMRAGTGAIEDVRLTGRGLRLTTIGNAPPVGLCGSGILAAISELLRIGLILPRGNIVKSKDLPPDDPRHEHLCSHDGKPALCLASGDSRVLITQKDIRQVQLAKGALLSGVEALLEQNGLGASDIDRVLIAGQFGAHLPVSSLTGCGIIPASLGGRVSYLGNTSKSGASMALLSRAARASMENLAKNVSYLELSRLEGFDRLFVACLGFPVPDAEPENDVRS